jgi:hypothetical protein
MEIVDTKNWALVFTNEEARKLFGEPRECIPGEFMPIPEEGPMGWGQQVPLDRDVSHIFDVDQSTNDHKGVHFRNGYKIERIVLSWIDKAQGDGYFHFTVIDPNGKEVF